MASNLIIYINLKRFAREIAQTNKVETVSTRLVTAWAFFVIVYKF